jgi:hypothetical protein
VKLLCHINGDEDLLQAWLDYYTGLGVTSFHFILHGAAEDNRRLFELTGRYPILVEDQYDNEFSSEEKRRRLQSILAGWRGQWVLLVDSDEFVEFPYPQVFTTIRALELLQANALAAPFVQRLTPDGSLDAPETIADPFRHFSMCSLDLCQQMGVQPATSKYPLFYCCETTCLADGGNHHPPNGRPSVLPPMQGATHHFKWRARALRRMVRRAESQHRWRHESARYLAYLQSHELQLPTADSFPYSRMELFRRGLLRKVQGSNVPPYVLRKMLGLLPGPLQSAAGVCYRRVRREVLKPQ